MAARPRRRAGLLISLAASVVLIVGATVAVTLAATRDRGAPAAQQTSASVTAEPAAPPAPAPSATSVQAPALLKLGAKADSAYVTSVAYAYKQPVAANAPKPDQDGYEWGAADVEVCAKGTGYLNNSTWVLTYADHTRIEASSVGYRQFPQPAYPWGDTDVTAGQCVRGWITYAVPAGKRPATVHYQPQGFQADWQVT